MVITATQNTRLSRRLLWGLIFLYILPGLFARSPWKPDDASGFGQSFALFQKPFAEWAISSIGDRLYAEGGLLAAWLAALLGKAAHALGLPHVWLDDVMRLGNVAWFILAGWAIWNTTYHLAKRTELQPENPLGTAPSRVDYARTAADASLLCFLSTWGLLVRSHMQVPEMAELAGIAVMLLGAVRALDRPIDAGWMLGLGVSIAFFARGWTHCLPMLLFFLISAITHPSVRFGLLRRMLRASLVFFVLLGLWWLWVQQQTQGAHWLQLWSEWNINRFLIIDPSKSLDHPTLMLTLKTLAWFLWPILPMAAWTMWRYRSAYREAAIRIPMMAALAGLLVLLITNPSDEANYFPLLPPLAVLAALGLSTMRKGLIAMIDWFSVLCFTLIATLVWLGWTASIFGEPAKLASKFARLSPGYTPEVIGAELMVAILASYAWVRLIVWRTSSRHQALWRPMVLSCGGITLIWLLMMTLWIPRIDYTKTFSTLADTLNQQIKHVHPTLPKPCVVDYNLGFAQRATLEYHSGLHLQRNTDWLSCQFLLLQDDRRLGFVLQKQFEQSHGETWAPIWTGQRKADKQEHFVLYQRKNPEQP